MKWRLLFAALLGLVVPPGIQSQEKEKPKPMAQVSVLPSGETRCDCQWLAFSETGQLVGVRSTFPNADDASIYVYGSGKLNLISTMVVKGGGGKDALGTAAHCGFGPEDRWVAYAEGENIRFASLSEEEFKELPRGKVSWPVLTAKTPLSSVWVAPDGKQAISIPDGGPSGRSLTLSSGKVEDLFRKVGPKPTVTIIEPTVNLKAGKFAKMIVDDWTERQTTVECWTLGANPERTAAIQSPKWASAIALSPNGTVLAIGQVDGTVGLYKTENGQKVGSFVPLHQWRILGLAFHPKGNTLLVISAASKERENCCIVDMATAKTRAAISISGLLYGCYSPSGERIATFNNRGELAVWNVNDLINAK